MPSLPVTFLFSEAKDAAEKAVSTSAAREEKAFTESSTWSMPRMEQAFSYMLPCLLLFTQEPMMIFPILLASSPFNQKQFMLET